MFICPKCTTSSAIFPARAGGGARAMCEELGVPFLGSLPVDPKLTKACDEGEDFVQLFGNSVTVTALNDIVEQVIRFFD